MRTCWFFPTVIFLGIGLGIAEGQVEAAGLCKKLLQVLRGLKLNSAKQHSPSETVQAQVHAYNARDLDLFLTYYSEDVVVFTGSISQPRVLSEQPALSGLPALRSFYRAAFDASPHLHAEILDRKEDGKTVTDVERVTGLRGSSDLLHATVSYEVHEGKITKVIILK